MASSASGTADKNFMDETLLTRVNKKSKNKISKKENQRKGKEKI
jgi:hypothetical protein